MNRRPQTRPLGGPGVITRPWKWHDFEHLNFARFMNMRIWLACVAIVVPLLIAGCGKTPSSKKTVTIEELNRVLRLASISPGGVPQSIDGLTNFPAFKGRQFPVPPDGKKFIIDPASYQVIMVDNKDVPAR